MPPSLAAVKGEERKRVRRRRTGERERKLKEGEGKEKNGGKEGLKDRGEQRKEKEEWE